MTAESFIVGASFEAFCAFHDLCGTESQREAALNLFQNAPIEQLEAWGAVVAAVVGAYEFAKVQNMID